VTIAKRPSCGQDGKSESTYYDFRKQKYFAPRAGQPKFSLKSLMKIVFARRRFWRAGAVVAGVREDTGKRADCPSGAASMLQ